MVDESYTRTLELLEGKKEELVKVAQLLMEKETINHEGNVDVVGVWGFEGDNTYEDYIKNKRHDVEVEAEEEEGVEEKKEEEQEVGGGGIPPLGLAFGGYMVTENKMRGRCFYKIKNRGRAVLL